MWTEVSRTPSVTSFNWLLLGYRSPHKPVDVVDRLDVCTDQGHREFSAVDDSRILKEPCPTYRGASALPRARMHPYSALPFAKAESLPLHFLNRPAPRPSPDSRARNRAG